MNVYDIAYCNFIRFTAHNLVNFISIMVDNIKPLSLGTIYSVRLQLRLRMTRAMRVSDLIPFAKILTDIKKKKKKEADS